MIVLLAMDPNPGFPLNSNLAPKLFKPVGLAAALVCLIMVAAIEYKTLQESWIGD